MGLKIDTADRLKNLPPYLFAQLDELKKEAFAKGKDLIDFGIGDPDIPTPEHIIKRLYEAARDPKTHRYATNFGLMQLRQAAAKWYEGRFGVEVDPHTEILPLIGSKEGISHIPLAFLNPGDAALVPDPCYPPYKSGTILAGGVPYLMPLLETNNFLPVFKDIDRQVARQAKLMFLNYPNNPTAATASKNFFEEAVKFARDNNIIVCHDAAYSEIAFDGYKPVSFLEVDGAKEIGIEFHSLSKTYNMTGWRMGFALGNKKVINCLAQVKSHIDSGIFRAVQFAGIVALSNTNHLAELLSIYKERRDVLVEGLKGLGWNINKPKATFYVWASVPSGYTSMELSKTLLDKYGIVVTPGVGFGQNGEGFIRFALTVSVDRIKESIERIKKFHG